MINKLFNKTKEDQDGFTLVEMIVAMTLFVVAATLISGIFVRTIRTQRQASHLMVLNSDAGLVLERIVRGVREGQNFTQPSSTGNCSSNLVFERNIGGSLTQVSYRLNNGDIERSEGGGSFNQLNSDSVAVRELCFIKTQETADDPWRITIVMRSGSVDENINYTADLQTTVTARTLPCETTGETCPYQ